MPWGCHIRRGRRFAIGVGGETGGTPPTFTTSRGEGHGRHEKEKEREKELTGFQNYSALSFKCSNKLPNTASSKKTKKCVFALEIVKVCLY